MITVASRTETAARVVYSFASGKIHVEELQALEYTLHIDSRVLAKAEAHDEPVAPIAANVPDGETESVAHRDGAEHA